MFVCRLFAYRRRADGCVQLELAVWQRQDTPQLEGRHSAAATVIIGVPDGITAGGRTRICPENAISKPEWRGREAAFGPLT